ncbi:MAG: transposase [Bacteroidaceae bacterium]|nr:transposase [Bacteroidaceae bacterium]
MARQARKASETGVYHVMMRGINHLQIFESEEDYYHFLSALQFAKEQIAPDGSRLQDLCAYYAYALMGNHVHLLIQARESTIGDIVKRIASSYVFYFNRKYGRDGHLFKERFRSEPCNDMSYFLTLLRYIHQNPVKAGLARRIEDYPYTSWHEYLNDYEFIMPICNVRTVLQRIQLAELKDLVETPLDEDIYCLDHEEKPTRKISDDQLLAYLKSSFGIDNCYDIVHLDKAARNEVLTDLIRIGGGIRQLVRLTGIGKHVIEGLREKMG